MVVFRSGSSPVGRQLHNERAAKPRHPLFSLGAVAGLYPSIGRLGVPVHAPDIAGRAAIEFPKAPTEIGKVVKANAIRNPAYAPVYILRITEHAMGACQTVIEKK